MKIKYVHTNIIAKDWESLADFYAKTLNCKKLLPKRNLKGVEVSNGAGVKNAEIKGIHLALPGYDENPPILEILQYKENKPKHPTASNREGITHLAFHVDNLEKCVTKFIKYGGSKIGEIASIRIPKKTIEFIYMADPENNIVELQTIHEGDNEMSKRDELVEKLKEQLDGWNKKINTLETKVQSATTSVQDKCRQELDSLKSKRDDLKTKLESAKNTGGEAIDELKAGLKETTGTLKKTFDNIVEKFKH
jgi:predicted enzyme related to lactoylglutathione lyase